jgi:hypothetical protein
MRRIVLSTFVVFVGVLSFGAGAAWAQNPPDLNQVADAVARHVVDGEPGLAAMALLMVVAAVGRKVLAARHDFWGTGAGAALLTAGLAFLGAFYNAFAERGALDSDTVRMAWIAFGGAAALYGATRPLMTWAAGRWPSVGTWLKPFLWLFDKPRANGIGTSPSKPGPDLAPADWQNLARIPAAQLAPGELEDSSHIKR